MAKHLSSKKNFTLLKSNLTDLLRLEGFDKLTISDQRNPASGLKQLPYPILQTHSPSDHDSIETRPDDVQG